MRFAEGIGRQVILTWHDQLAGAQFTYFDALPAIFFEIMRNPGGEQGAVAGHDRRRTVRRLRISGMSKDASGDVPGHQIDGLRRSIAASRGVGCSAKA